MAGEIKILNEALDREYSIYSSKPLPSDLKDKLVGACEYVDRHKRGNCGPSAINVAGVLKEENIKVKKVQGIFKVDIPDYGIDNFKDDELEHMETLGFDHRNESDRIKYIHQIGEEEEFHIIVHYWAWTREYGIIDVAVKQFKQYMNTKITDKNYSVQQEWKWN
jgi:hypothetical protein